MVENECRTLGLKRVASTLKQRGGRVQEMAISEPETRVKTFRNRFSDGTMDAYDQALRFEQKLLAKFDGKSLETVIPGKVVSTEYGTCYQISDEHDLSFQPVTFEESRRLILSNLHLLYGIGPVREDALKKRGYRTIEDLKRHPIWRPSALDFLRLIDAKQVGLLQKWLWRRLPKSHPLVHYLAGFCRDEDFAIVDIETLGLFGRPIILLGVAFPRKGKISTHQYLLRDISDEVGALWAFISMLRVDQSFITFNGRAFDIPYIQQRLAYYGMNASLNQPHFDLLHFTRRALRSKLENCRLETVEHYLGLQRAINIPSALVPHFYHTYLRTRNIGPLVPILEHNKQDLLTLAHLFSKLYEEWDVC
jgi:uncharacterized protein YprB with RNaseH-like and TPR domain